MENNLKPITVYVTYRSTSNRTKHFNFGIEDEYTLNKIAEDASYLDSGEMYKMYSDWVNDFDELVSVWYS